MRLTTWAAKLLFNMLRPFQLFDLRLLRRLGRQRVPLNVEVTLTQQPDLLAGALRHLLVGGDFPTYIWKGETGGAAGFVQAALTRDGVKAHLVYLGAAPADRASEEDVWLAMLDALTAHLGAQGVHTLVAEVDELGAELPFLRQANFAIFTRQDVYIRSPSPKPAAPTPCLVPYRPQCQWDVQWLYAHIAPSMIQLVEPGPPTGRRSWVWYEGHELVGYVQVAPGPVAQWLHLLIHPKAQGLADQIVDAALRVLPGQGRTPLYCTLRRYQSWLQEPLERHGFNLWGSQAMMVRHTTHLARKLTPALDPALAKESIVARPTSLIRKTPHFQ